LACSLLRSRIIGCRASRRCLFGRMTRHRGVHRAAERAAHRPCPRGAFLMQEGRRTCRYAILAGQRQQVAQNFRGPHDLPGASARGARRPAIGGREIFRWPPRPKASSRSSLFSAARLLREIELELELQLIVVWSNERRAVFIAKRRCWS